MGWNYLSIRQLQRLRRWSLGMNKWFHPTFYNGCHLSMLGFKLNHISKRGPRQSVYSWIHVLYLTCPSGALHWHWGNHTIAPVPVKQPWRIWVKLNHNKTQQSANRMHDSWDVLWVLNKCMGVNVYWKLTSESCYDTNFVVSGSAAGCRLTECTQKLTSETCDTS